MKTTYRSANNTISEKTEEGQTIDIFDRIDLAAEEVKEDIKNIKAGKIYLNAEDKLRGAINQQ